MKKGKAWDVLTSDEQMSITLSLSHGKSSWEIGEIMGKSHYKLLEIMGRGKRFFRLFGDYFDEYEELFPISGHVHPDFVMYMEKSILDRLPLKKVLNYIGAREYFDNKLREKEIVNNMKLLKKNKLTKDLHDLILEFDRWNNHRILPESIQELSAFKRRNKTKEKNRLKLVSSLPALTLDIIKSHLKSTNKKRGLDLYVPLIDDREKNKKIIIKISNDYNITSKLNYMGLYYFSDYNQAIEYIDLVKGFVYNDEVSCKKGLVFWPQFRVLASKALNYNKLENIQTNRKYFEKMLGTDDRQTVRKIKEKVKVAKGSKSAQTKAFWG